MSETIFQPTDLVKKRTEVMNAARGGLARLRDSDGTSYVMVPEGRLTLLEELAEWSQALIKLEALLRRGSRPTVSELGELAWLRGFDASELREFIEELHDALVVAHAEGELALLEDCLRGWRATARQLADPLRRSVLLGSHNPDDFEEASEPADGPR
jgi:hypothetical protein